MASLTLPAIVSGREPDSVPALVGWELRDSVAIPLWIVGGRLWLTSIDILDIGQSIFDALGSRRYYMLPIMQTTHLLPGLG